MAIKVERFETAINESNKNMINLKGGIVESRPNGGCGWGSCKCSEGHWISVVEPMKDNRVKGTRFVFDTREELEAFKKGI